MTRQEQIEEMASLYNEELLDGEAKMTAEEMAVILKGRTARQTPHGIDVRLIELSKSKSGCKGPYKIPTKLDYKILYERLKLEGNARLAWLAWQVAGPVNRL